MSKKIIVINKGWAKALGKSVEKWEKLAADPHSAEDDCALCEKDKEHCPPLGECHNCPICLDTGEANCDSTPYWRWSTAHFADRHDEAQAVAKNMLTYLKDLKSRCKMLPGIKINRVKE